MRDYVETTQNNSLVDLKNYKQSNFFLRFNKKKIEKSYLIENLSQNLYLIKVFFGIIALFNLFSFEFNSELIIELEILPPIMNFFTMILAIGLIIKSTKSDKLSIKDLILIKLLSELAFLLCKIRVCLNNSGRTMFLMTIFLDYFSINMNVGNFEMNLIGIFTNNLIMKLLFQLKLTNLLMIIVISAFFAFIQDSRNRKKWILLDQTRKCLKTLKLLFNSSINPQFIIDINKRILYMNAKGEKIYETDNNDSLTKTSKKKFNNKTLLKIISEEKHEIFEKQLSESKEFSNSQMNLEISMSKDYNDLEELKTASTEQELGFIHEFLGSESIFDLFTEKNEVNKSFAKRNISDLNVKNNNLDESAKSQNIKIPFSANIHHILLNSRPCFMIEFKDIFGERKIINRTLHSFDECSENSFEMLTCCENDYVKWYNLQGNSQVSVIIKESDLKNLANCLYLINILLNKIQRKKELAARFTNTPLKMHLKFHLKNTMIYFIEVALLKSIDKSWEVNLIFEESFPDFVSGEYYRFKTFIFIIFKIIFLYTNFAKHSKFKIHCKLKEVVNSVHEDGKYILLFDFDIPYNQSLASLFELTFTNPIFSDVSKHISITLQKTKDHRQEFLSIKSFLISLDCKYTINNFDGNRYFLSLEMPFNIVTHLETLMNGNSFDSTIHSSNVGSPLKSVCFNHRLLNLTFMRSQLKKNVYCWKPKQKKNEINIHPGLNNAFSAKKEQPPPQQNFNNINEESKKKEEIPNETNNLNVMKSQTSINSNQKEEAPFLRKSIKRRDSKISYLAKAASGGKNEDEIKVNPFESENPLAIASNKKSCFGNMSSFEEKLVRPSISKLKETSLFPPLLTNKINELKMEKKQIISKFLLKDVLLLLKQQTVHQQKKISSLYKSESYIPHNQDLQNENDSINIKNGVIESRLKYNSFSCIDDLKKFDYEAFRAFILSTCPFREELSPISPDYTQKELVKKKHSPLSKKNKPYFTGLFSPLQRKNYISIHLIQRDEILKKRSRSFLKSQNFAHISVLQNNSTISMIEKAQEIFSPEQIETFLIPFAKKDQINFLPLGIKLRLETRLSRWNSSGDRAQSMGILRLKKIKKNRKFSILVSDDNINSLQIFQKMQFNPNLQIYFGQNLANSLDIFIDFLENGYNYDIIFIDLCGKTMNGIELMKNIRGIEKLIHTSCNSYIVGILTTEKQSDLVIDEKGINEYIIRPVNEGMIHNIINRLSSETLL